MGLEHEIMGAGIQRAEMPSRTVVAGFDGSDLARAALALARRRAGPRGKVVAVYAAPLVPDVAVGWPAAAPPPPQTSPEEIAKSILEGIADEKTVTRQARGYPAKALVEVAQVEGADEIVVGSHGAGRLRALLGSTSHELLHEADRPVVILTQRACEHAEGAGEPAHLIVLGYDGSEDARVALSYARRHLAHGGEILAVHACNEPPDWKGTRSYNADIESRLERGRRLLTEIEDSPEVSVELIPDSPAAALARIASLRGADEIVVGSRGVEKLRAALGSVAHALLHEADRPIVIVPLTADAA